MISFGDKVTDCVTGFSGIAVERCEFITGCVVWGVQPRIGEDELIPGAEYFEEERLMLSLKELKAIKSGRQD